MTLKVGIDRIFKRPLLAAAAFAILGLALKWISTEFSGRDWAYFDSLSWLVRSSVWHYHRLPIHDPWCGGGVSLLSNPQNRLFSPFLLFDLLLPPYWANLGSLTVLAFFGIWGMGAFLEEIGIAAPARWIAAVVFINGSWFGLHYAEGHIPFGSMMLLPWVLACVKGIEKRGRIPLLATLFAFFVLDGGIYTLIFSIFAIGSLFASGLKPASEFIHALRKQSLLAILAFAGAVAASMPKLYPVLTELSGRKPILDQFQIPPLFLIKAFFWPLQRLSTRVFGHPERGMHEFGCYLGVMTFVCVFRSLWKKTRALSGSLRIILVCLFWGWVATGWIDPFNPWRLFQHLPLLNNAHLQSRTLILLFLFYMILAARAFAGLDLRSRNVGMLLSLILLESIFVRNYADIEDFRLHGTWPTSGWIESSTLERSVAKMDKPDLYRARNTAVVHCYEPSMAPPPAIPEGEPGYRGEIFAESPRAISRIVSYVPGELVVEVDSPETTHVVVNTRDLGAWKLLPPTPSEARILSSKNERLSFTVPAGRSVIRSAFGPSSLPWTVTAWVLGLLLLTRAWVLDWNRREARS